MTATGRTTPEIESLTPSDFAAEKVAGNAAKEDLALKPIICAGATALMNCNVGTEVSAATSAMSAIIVTLINPLAIRIKELSAVIASRPNAAANG